MPFNCSLEGCLGSSIHLPASISRNINSLGRFDERDDSEEKLSTVPWPPRELSRAALSEITVNATVELLVIAEAAFGSTAM